MVNFGKYLGRKSDEADETDLARDDKAREYLPAPLDPHIASVSLDSFANRPVDGFDVEVLASFGREKITLGFAEDNSNLSKDEKDEEIELELSIYKAEIIFDTFNCKIIERRGPGDTEYFGTDNRTTLKTSTSGEVRRNRGFGAEANFGADSADVGIPGAKGNINGKFDNAKSTSTKTDLKKERIVGSWHFQDLRTIRIDGIREENVAEHLDGMIIDHAKVLRVLPDPGTEGCSVLARIRVREPWIELKNVKIKSDSLDGNDNKFRRGLKDLLTKEGDKAEQHRNWFRLFLKKLIFLNLQSADEKQSATLCTDALILGPASDLLFHPEREPAHSVKIQAETLVRFIKGDSVSRTKIVKEIPLHDRNSKIFEVDHFAERKIVDIIENMKKKNEEILQSFDENSSGIYRYVSLVDRITVRVAEKIVRLFT